MPQTPHVERHFKGSAVVRDVVIGMSDGLTVPFALAAGLSGAVASSGVVLTAGFAEIAAGSIAMGLGGYLAARTDADHYERERQREIQETHEKPHVESEEVREVFRTYGLTEEEIGPVAEAIQRHPDHWVDFMMRFELGLEKPERGRAVRSALVIAAAYVAGGLIPLLPYAAFGNARAALGLSVSVTLGALLVFGFVKGRLTGARPVRGAIQTAATGGIAAAAAFAIARLVA